ncbi:MAG: hypothetical protein ABSA48_04140 [Terracidiphilus sp.]|jgi:hypothetical protein
MSPREKHIPDNAVRTTVGLTALERAAIRWISDARRSIKDRRTTTNDVLVDALWYFLEKVYDKTKEQISAMAPPLTTDEHPKRKITQMPKPKSGH